MAGLNTNAWIKNLYVGTLRTNLCGNAALIIGNGTSTSPLTNASADKNFIDFNVKSTSATGTIRGLYQRLYLSGGAGGEAGRFYTTVEANAPVDTCNGIHTSLSFGSSAGNITGIGTALRGTVHVPGRSLGGTVAALQAEFYGDAASGAIGGTASFLRCVTDGHADAKGSFDTNGFFFEISGLTAGAGKVLRANAPATLAASLRVKVGATTYYLPLYSAAV